MSTHIVFFTISHGNQVHSALQDWADGYLKKSDFGADTNEDIYQGHKLFLAQIKERDLGAYHRLTHQLYNKVSCIFISLDILCDNILT